MSPRPRIWTEPAHPVLVRHYEALTALYGHIKQTLQSRIDEAFDHSSQQIGFIVTTTLPVTCRVGEGGRIEAFELQDGNLQGTIFQKEFTPLLQEFSKRPAAGVAAGTYTLLLLWHEALKLRLKADWLEPAHFLHEQVGRVVRPPVANLPEVREPAHWFDAGIAFDEMEEVLIAAIDEVYTDLRLAERVAMARRVGRIPLPYPGEPVHFRPLPDDLLGAQRAQQALAYVREPAHFRQIQDRLGRERATALLDEMLGLLQRYGV